MVEAADALSEEVAPAQRLTPQQRATLMAYARAGSIESAAALLGIGGQTIKNHLTDAYRRLGVKSGPQAIYVLMGGEGVLRALPTALPRQSHRLRGAPLHMPTLVDGQMSLGELRQAARVGDLEAGNAGPDCAQCGLPPGRATLTELIDWLAYYVRPKGWSRST